VTYTKVLVCGGRHYSDRANVYRALNALMDELETPLFVIHGKMTGADMIAGDWAALRGQPCAEVKPLWDYYDRSAGPRRNEWMLFLQPDLVVAFPGNDGTRNMIAKAEAAGVPVRRIV
jgi:hypothetical protein